ncbi:MAG: enoyl-CoA hydratase/isomerase family protein [Candidatus Obscuribacter sp.]|jgi:enoyl-CoA hydratase/carnithine racemase|nr:enoyl-CoA hydratase/isomerase family protein [Candidatus Obscuribacter sp.]
MPQANSPDAVFTGLPAESYGFKRIIYDKTGYIATITINRPDVLNCFDTLTLKELGQAFLDAGSDDAIAVVVITGAGDKAFCTGADLREQEEHILHKPNNYHKWMYTFIEMHDRLRNLGKPTIARLNGMTVGGGNELNMACDLAVAADHVTIRQVGAARGSVAAGGATQWLPMIVGDRRAREMLLLCEPIDAYTALDWGLVNQVVPASMLDSTVKELAEKLYNKLPECTRYTKQQLNFWRDFSWSMTVGHARDWLTVHAGSYETAEGLSSFRKKQPMDYAKIRARGAKPMGTANPAFDTTPCSACNSDNPVGNAFCGACGHKL